MTTSGQPANKPQALIGVVHLVWVPLGIEPLRSFLHSYIGNRSGMDHDLLVVYNGYRDRKETAGHQQLLAQVPHQALYLDRAGQDIQSYYAAAEQFTNRYFCFLNSYSRVQSDDWLLKLYAQVTQEGIGLVGATGSWESLYTNFLNGIPSKDSGPFLERLLTKSRRALKQARRRHWFDPFPNYHLRTNGFMITRDVLQKVHCGRLARKMDAYRFESGKNSLTRQVQRMGLDVLIVGRDGRGYRKEEWDASATFRQGGQANLLIADNQTDSYEAASGAEQQVLSARAWGLLPRDRRPKE